MYMRVQHDCGRVIEVDLYYPGNYGAPGISRRKKQKRTPEDIKRQNQTNRVRKVKQLILVNYKEGDWHLTLNYGRDKRPETPKQANDNLRRFLDRLRAIYKKAGHTFKYIGVTEIGKKGQALHHHLIIENLEDMETVKLVKELWEHGNTFWSAMYEDGEFEQLASYIVKKETKIGSWSTYTRSRNNLKEPTVKRERMRRRSWPENPWIKKGYIMVKDSLVEGFNPVTGYPYRRYTMRKIEPERRDKNARNNLHRNEHEGAG